MIDILLSTYNGEKYIKEQLDSIISQTNINWQLKIRDDGSTDKTIEIIEGYIQVYSNKIILCKDDNGRLGSTLSFSKLLELSSSKYIMLCDQDDVWLNNKIEITLNGMLEMENRYGDIPLMVFTDLREVDQELNLISESFIKSQKLDPTIINNATKLASMNVVAGCTTMINKKAIQYILPIYSKYVTHDQWIAINIAKFGKIKYLDVATILYRQHSNNVLGAYKIGISYFFNKIMQPIKQLNIYRDLLTGLNFKINVFGFAYYKMVFTIKRLIN